MSPRISVRVSTVVIAAALSMPVGYSQGRGGAPAGGGGGTGTTGTPSTGTTGTPGPGTGRGIPTTPSTNPTPTQPTIQQPVFVSGKVLMEDGAPPTESVAIERVCGGQQHTEGYTDSKGYFSLELGRRNNGVLVDASEDTSGFNSGGMMGNSSAGGLNSRGMGSMGLGDARFINCELRARLAGYRSQVVSLANRRALDNPDIGTILLHRIGSSEGSTVSAVSLAAPKDARKAYEKGMDLLKKKKADDAIKSFQKAAELYPKYSIALTQLGKLQMMRGETEPARESFQTAIQADPKFVVPYVELSFLESQGQHWKEVAAATETATKLDPFSYPQAYFLNAVANYNLKNMEAAEKSAREAERLDTRHQFPKNTHLLGIILAQRQDFTGAAEQFKAYLKLAPEASDAATVKNQLEQVEKISASAGKQDQ
jgi:tetratricopeptide (TPR) repeat protein